MKRVLFVEVLCNCVSRGFRCLQSPRQNMSKSSSTAFAALRQARLLKDDTVLRCNIGPFNISAVRTTNVQRNAGKRWHWSKEQISNWSHCSTATLLLASFLTGEERVRARMMMGHHYMGVTEAMSVGEVRGSFDATPEALALNKEVQLTIDKILYGATQPFTSSIAIPMSSDKNNRQHTQLAYQEYLNKSEQGQCSRLVLLDGAEMATHHHEKTLATEDTTSGNEWSGGIMISSLGHVGMSKENGMASANVEKEVIGAFGEWWDEEQQQKATLFGSDFITMSSQVGMVDALQNMLSTSPLGSYDMNEVRVRSCDFHCRCAKEQFLAKINMLPVSDIVSIMNDMSDGGDGEASLDLMCHHCNQKHPMLYEDLEAMLSS